MENPFWHSTGEGIASCSSPAGLLCKSTQCFLSLGKKEHGLYRSKTKVSYPQQRAGNFSSENYSLCGLRQVFSPFCSCFPICKMCDNMNLVCRLQRLREDSMHVTTDRNSTYKFAHKRKYNYYKEIKRQGGLFVRTEYPSSQFKLLYCTHHSTYTQVSD